MSQTIAYLDSHYIDIPNYITQINNNEYLIYSQDPKRKDKQYIVTMLDSNVYACSCPDFTYRHNHDCKHIRRVRDLE